MRIIEAIVSFFLIIILSLVCINYVFFLYNRYIAPPETGGAPAEYIDYYIDCTGELMKDPALSVHIYGKKWAGLEYEQTGTAHFKEAPDDTKEQK